MLNAIAVAAALLSVSPDAAVALAHRQKLLAPVHHIHIQENPSVTSMTWGVLQPFLGESDVIRVRESAHGVKAGDVYGKWTVLGAPFSRSGNMWGVVVACSCGRIDVADCGNLKAAKSTRCCRCRAIGGRLTHGHTAGRRAGKKIERLYGIWRHMRERCSNPNKDGYEWYGGKGITVCQEWQSYPAFRSWAMANGYADNLTIDRIKSDLNYEPENCRWITQQQNSSLARRQALAKGGKCA